MIENINLGVDIGGSHITSALVNIADGSILDGSWYRSKVDSQGNAAEILDSWCGVMQNSLQSAPNSGKIGVAMPGPFDYENGISQMRGMGKFDSLYGLDVGSLLVESLGKYLLGVSFINDASCFLKGEIAHGPAARYAKVLGLTLGTGFGSALAIDGLVNDAAYWQHPFMGGICEDFFSSKWLVSRYNKYSGKTVENVKELIDNVEKANPLFQVFDEFSMNLGMFLAKLNKTQNLDCLVIGGNIAKASSLFLPQLNHYLKLRAINCPIFISSKGENAALIGAACSFIK